MDKLEKEELALVAMIMRNIWIRRNKFVFNKKLKPPYLGPGWLMRDSKSLSSHFYQIITF